MSAWDPLSVIEHAAIAEEIVSVLRHDLRNKLGTFRNASYYIRRRVSKTELWSQDPRIGTLLHLVDEEVEAGNRLLDGLALKHLFSREVARQDGLVCVQSGAKYARLAPDRDIRIEIEGSSGEIEVDGTEVALAVRCLLENAAEATPNGGLVRVYTRLEPPHFVVDVDDGGPGIPETGHESAFRPFSTSKPGHVGLGLNIALRIARRYQGDLILGQGARGGLVRIVLPLVDQEASL